MGEEDAARVVSAMVARVLLFRVERRDWNVCVVLANYRSLANKDDERFASHTTALSPSGCTPIWRTRRRDAHSWNEGE